MDKLQTVLEKHKLWLAYKENVKRADLHGADLCNMSLIGVDL